MSPSGGNGPFVTDSDRPPVRVFIGYNPALPVEELSNLHFTNGGPYFDEYKDCGYADLWFEERDRMLSAV